MLDEIEIRRTHGDSEFAWDIEAWTGKDLNKLWIKSEGERDDGDSSDVEFQALYSRAITAFWNLQLGWRGDTQPGRDWLVIGAQGLAPYFIDIDANLFIGGSGKTGLRLNAEKDFMLTRRWVLAPKLEINAYAGDDTAAARGSGLSDFEAALHLRYEIRREVAPYAGIRWKQSIGDSRSLQRSSGADTSKVQVVIGLNAWF